MAVTITNDTSIITISGRYKEFLSASGSSTTVIQFSSGEAPAGADAGRFLQWRNNTGNTSTWETRFILSATSSTVTVGDGGFSASPGSGETFVISTNLDDLVAATSACTVQGTQYSFGARNWRINSGGFLADVDKAIDTENTSSSIGWQVANGCAIQFGRLTGGEANGSTITRQGCAISMNNARTSAGCNVFGNGGSEVVNGPIVNFYGCYIKNYTRSAAAWAFMRGTGPVRMIGTIWDGPIGGAFYHSASELADTKFRGNTNLTPAWSIRATFARAVSAVQFANGLAAFKTFSTFTGIFRDSVFDLDSLGTAVFVQGSTGGGATLIDCTTFDDSYTTDSGNGFINQGKSINYTITDADGVGQTGVKVAVYDTDGTLQGSIQTSASGVVSEIVALSRKWLNSSPSSNKAPFDIRIRKYGLVYQGFQSAVSEPIKQEVRNRDNAGLVSSESQAAAITGISINFATKTLTITEDTNTQELYDRYQYQLDQSANMQYPESFVRTGIAFNIDDWAMNVNGCTYTGDVTTTGLITLGSGGLFNGTRTDANGTVTTAALSVAINEAGCDVVILAAGTSTVLASVNAQAGNVFDYTYSTIQDVDIGVIKPGFTVTYTYGYTLPSTDSTFPVSLGIDRSYV